MEATTGSPAKVAIIGAAVQGLGPWNGRIVIDANKPIEAPDFRPFYLGGRGSSEIVPGPLPSLNLVRFDGKRAR